MKRRLAVSIVTGLNIAIAVAVQFYVLFRFGVGSDTDAYVASQTLPLVASSLLTTTLAQALVPILVAEPDPIAAAWTTTRTLTIVALPIVLLLMLGADYWVPWLFLRISESTNAVVDLTRIQLVTVLAAAMLAAPLARLYGNHQVLAAEGSFFAASVLAAALMPVLSNRYGIRGASLALLARPLLQFVILVPVLGRSSGDIDRVALNAKVWRHVRPLVGGAPIYKLGPVVDRVLGSLTPGGHLTALVYGQHAWNFGLTLFDRVLAKPLLATESKLLFEGKKAEARSAYLLHLRWAAAAAALAVGAFWLGGESTLRIVSAFTQLTTTDAALLYDICLVLGGMLLAGGVGQIALAAVFAIGDTRSVTRIAIMSFVIATTVKLVLLSTAGVFGIAIGAVCYQIMSFVGLHRCFMKATA